MKKKFLAAVAAGVLAAAVYLVVSPPAVVPDIRIVARHGPLASALVDNDLCYGVLLQGRSEEDVRTAELGPRMDSRLSWLGADVDRERGEIRTGVDGELLNERKDGSRYTEAYEHRAGPTPGRGDHPLHRGQGGGQRGEGPAGASRAGH